MNIACKIQGLPDAHAIVLVQGAASNAPEALQARQDAAALAEAEVRLSRCSRASTSGADQPLHGTANAPIQPYSRAYRGAIRAYRHVLDGLCSIQV